VKVALLASTSVPAGPRGLAFTGEQTLFVYSFLDRSVVRVEREPDPKLHGHFFSPASSEIVVARSTLTEEQELGRRLFYATDAGEVSSPNIGISCATCHFDGRTDGLSWPFQRGLRQTPSLAGPVSMTAPVRWEGDRVSVADDVMQTSQNLMGGVGLTMEQAELVAAFVDSTRDVDVPGRGSSDERVARGKEIFERPEVGCATCHHGPRFTDNRKYSMFDLPSVKTRSLVGIAGSPPYLHDGSAKTLRDLLLRLRDGSMGNTSTLTDEELDDLEAYLMSL
jgi:cytochrome c peroxidase